MRNNSLMLALLLAATALSGCSRMSLHEDYGRAVSKNIMLQTEDLGAATASHPAVKMDGQKANTVVENYRSERPEVDAEDLTK